MDENILKFRVAVLCSTAFIIAAFGLSYFFWGHDALPIGWDTPHYIEESRIVASQGPAALLAIQGPYDIVYPLLSGLIVRSGVSAIALEIYLPVALAAMFPYLLSRLPLINQDLRMATAVAVATPGWYAIYDIGGDKHANLLGLVFILAALPLLFRSKSIRQSQSILGLVFIGIASFTHVETTLFFVTIIIISSVALSIFPPRIAFLAAAVTLPATVVYISRALQLVGLIGYSLPVVNLEPILFWLEVFGPLLPLALYGLLAPTIGRRSRLEAFAVIWASCSLVVGISQYFNGQTYIFAQRAATIVPIPLLAAVGLVRLRLWASRLRPDKPPLKYFQKRVLLAALMLILVSWPVTYWAVGSQNHKVFLASSAYQRLEWISNNMRFANTPIFVYNDLDLNAGGHGDLYSNWVGAIVGPHLSYLGRVDYLAQIQQTPFSNIISRWQSAIFMKQIYDTGITSRTILFEHPIILVEDFYNPFPLPTYIAGFFRNVSDGVFEGDNARLATLYNMTLPLSSSLTNSVGPWNTTQRSWARSIYALEAKVNSTPTDLEASFLLEIPTAGTYSLGLRYWDGSGNDLEVVLDGATVGTVHYNDTGVPLIGNFTGVHLASGLHGVSVKIGQNRAFQQYASLDYLVVSRS